MPLRQPFRPSFLSFVSCLLFCPLLLLFPKGWSCHASYRHITYWWQHWGQGKPFSLMKSLDCPWLARVYYLQYAIDKWEVHWYDICLGQNTDQRQGYGGRLGKVFLGERLMEGNARLPCQYSYHPHTGISLYSSPPPSFPPVPHLLSQRAREYLLFLLYESSLNIYLWFTILESSLLVSKREG